LMTDHCVEVPHVPRVGLVQEVVQYHLPPPVSRLPEIGDAPVLHDPSSRLGQLLAMDCRIFAETPYDVAKIGHHAQSV
jgi:hypothetical protein